MTSPLVSTDLDRALDSLRRGGVVAIPTETVYGLAADARNATAVRRIFAIKGRPVDHPLIVHLAGVEQLGDWASAVPESAAALVTAAWPGPLTVIVPRADGVLDEVTGGHSTVGLRVPAHPMAMELLERFGGGLAAPSANRFGSVSPTTAAHVLGDLGAFLDPSLDLILDGGACPVGVESTIVDCVAIPPQILRAGGVPTEDIERLLDGHLAAADGPSRAAGMLASHYAPACRIELVDDAAQAAAAAATTPHSDILDFGDDLVAYAHDLYARLRDADERRLDTLIAVLPPARGLGHAIRDRLAKAAAPRPR